MDTLIDTLYKLGQVFAIVLVTVIFPGAVMFAGMFWGLA